MTSTPRHAYILQPVLSLIDLLWQRRRSCLLHPTSCLHIATSENLDVLTDLWCLTRRHSWLPFLTRLWRSPNVQLWLRVCDRPGMDLRGRIANALTYAITAAIQRFLTDPSFERVRCNDFCAAETYLQTCLKQA